MTTVTRYFHSTVSRRVFTYSPRELGVLPQVAAAWHVLYLVVVVVVLMIPVPLVAMLPRGEFTVAFFLLLTDGLL